MVSNFNHIPSTCYILKNAAGPSLMKTAQKLLIASTSTSSKRCPSTQVRRPIQTRRMPLRPYIMPFQSYALSRSVLSNAGCRSFIWGCEFLTGVSDLVGKFDTLTARMRFRSSVNRRKRSRRDKFPVIIISYVKPSFHVTQVLCMSSRTTASSTDPSYGPSGLSKIQ